MDDNKSNNEQKGGSAPEIYHTVSGKPETLKELKKEQPHVAKSTTSSVGLLHIGELEPLDLDARPGFLTKSGGEFSVSAVIAFAIFFYFAYVWTHWSVPHPVYNIISIPFLLLHEYGHLKFAFFGTFMEAIGGTLSQISAPIAISFILFKQRFSFLGSFSLLLLGDIILRTARYMGDAQAMKLPLSDFSLQAKIVETHDWNSIFSSLGVLPYTSSISMVTYTLGGIVLFYGLYGMYKYSGMPATRSDE